MASYSNVFSVEDPVAARAIRDGLDSGTSTDAHTSSIVVDPSSKGPDQHADLDFGNDDSDGQTAPGDPSSPSSSVAMIVLYTVTGVIAALFFGVIVTGAIRAHLHPERYGPRNVVGRPRQSRARGVARAMLETLPIVKFGDLDEVRHESQKPDVEMASHEGDQEEGARHQQDEAAAAAPQQDGQAGDSLLAGNPATSSPSAGNDAPTEDESSKQAHITNGQREPGDREHKGPAPSSRPGTPRIQNSATRTLGCPICAEDFVKGEDVRLLPCKHKFHPKCVDHWLVDVSGTCPLW